MARKRRNLLTLTALCLAIGLFIFLGVMQTRNAAKTVAQTHDVPETQSGLPKIGGAFELVDKNGKIWKDTDFKGKPMLVYFGYTYCPDICPTALYNLTQALEKLGGSKVIQPIFITIDPKRDTPFQLNLYAQNFHKDFIMLTGSKTQIDQAMKVYRVHAARASEERGEEDYLMDHSSIIYLMDRDGNYRAHFNHQTPSEEIVERVRQYRENGK